MRKKIIAQTKNRVNKLLDKNQVKKNLKNLKNARYMRKEYAQRKKRLNLTFDLDEFQRVKQEAEQVGITPTAFLRESVLSYLEKARVPSRSTEQKFSELIFLLRNMSNNLNQIAHQANTIQKLSMGDLIQAKALMGSFEDTLEAFMKRF